MFCLPEPSPSRQSQLRFPSEGRPYASVIVDAYDVEYRVIAHDDVMLDLESLEKGDAVSIQGTLVLVREKGKLAGIYVVAKQVNPLRQRSRNKLPVQMARSPML